MEFEAPGPVRYTNQNLGGGGIGDDRDNFVDEITPLQAKVRFREFLRNYRERGDNYIYREQLLQRYRNAQYYLEVSLDDVFAYDDDLQDLLQRHPKIYIAQFEA